MSNPLPNTIPAPSRLAKIFRVVKRMLAVAAALDSAEAITLRDKRRILSVQMRAVHKEDIGMTGQIVDYPQQRNQVQPGLQSERLAS